MICVHGALVITYNAAMAAAHRHTIHQQHHGWDRSFAPVARIAPGESLEFAVSDQSGGQLGQTSTVGDVTGLDFAKINPVAGPVFIDGAEPGDVLKVTLLSFAPSGWGWTANIPGFGLLADEFKEPALHLWQYDPTTLAPALFGRWGKAPLKPFTGTIGVAPAEPGFHSILPPRRVGRRHGMPAVDAYLLCSVCGDLRISEIVDVPNWTVSFYFPRIVLD